MSSKLLPFVCRKCALRHLPTGLSARRIFVAQFQTLASRPAGIRGDPIPFDLPEDIERNTETDDQGTITPAERDAFDKIFEELAARRPLTNDPAPEPTASRQRSAGRQTSSRRIQPAPSNTVPYSGETLANVLRQGAASANEPANFETAATARTAHEAARRFPKSLQHAARSALGILQLQEVASPVEQAGIQENERKMEELTTQTIAARLEFRQGVEDRMRASKSDFELWEVMEKEVFTMVDRLGIGMRHKRVQASKKKKGAPAQESELNMQILGPCYPSLLLYGLRLLDEKFARPSPLIASVLPKIKELGLASFVLGVSTPFYNTLMSSYWRRFGDFESVLSLLVEMKNAGLYFDDASLELVTSMQSLLEDRTRTGGVPAQIRSMPAYDDAINTELGDWIVQIKQSIRERADILGY
jgi:hypothetical protein